MFLYNTSAYEDTKYTPHALVVGKIACQSSADSPLEESMDLTYSEYLIELFCRIRNVQNLGRKNLINSKLKYKIITIRI